MSPSLFQVSSFVYSLLAFASTYSLRATQETPLRLYYISGILNSPTDTLSRFFVRWTLWSFLSFILFFNLRLYLPFRLSLLVPVAWIVCIVTGFDFRVVGGPKPSDVLFYTHSVATGFVMLTSTFTLYCVGFRRSSAFWFVVSGVYGVLYFSRLFVPGFEYPPQSFMITEYVFYLYFSSSVTILLPL